MPSHPTFAAWFKGAGVLVFILMLAACAEPHRLGPGPGTWAGRPLGSPPAPKPHIKQAILARALREWQFFGQQTVVMTGTKESIPNVGAWEDDDSRFSSRVNSYWRAVGKPGISGEDCRQPWSSAFLGWVMGGAGVPQTQFPRVPAHWSYLMTMIEEAAYPGRYFVPRRVSDYSPNPGDLICAYRGNSRPTATNGYISAQGLIGKSAHCDLVVEKQDRTLEVIGGNVRNSVSKVTLQLDGSGHLQPVPRRPWFLILQNRL